jgi:hypothetical protein
VNGWERVCQDCWQAINPDQYCPDLTDHAECVVCGEHGLTLGVRAGHIEKRKAQKEATE